MFDTFKQVFISVVLKGLGYIVGYTFLVYLTMFIVVFTIKQGFPLVWKLVH